VFSSKIESSQFATEGGSGPQNRNCTFAGVRLSSAQTGGPALTAGRNLSKGDFMKILFGCLLTLVSVAAFAGEGNGEPFPSRNPGQNVPATCGPDVGQESVPHCPGNVIVTHPGQAQSCPNGQELVYDRGFKRWMCEYAPVQGSGG
jgi:hypothetical protein